MPNEIARLKAEMREADGTELARLLATFKQEHFNLRMNAATSALENPKRIRFVRKAVARIEGELHRRRQGDQA
jgi:large subunit ribosomal protein L29